VNVSVVLPTYDERENIAPLIESLCQVLADAGVDYQIVVVDDNSPDGTADLVRRRYSAQRRVKLICRNGQRGLATAVKTGIAESSGDVIVFMDADFSHDPQALPLFLSGLGDNDLVNGSRYLPAGGFQGSTRARLFSWVINWYLRIVLGLRTTDNTSGFVAIKRSLLSQLDLEGIFYGYGDFHFRLMYDSFRNCASITEVPVVHRLRRSGRAKTRLLKDGWGYVISAMRIRLGMERL
jgi:dolichol-phosphate mannosyltransferase